MSVPVLLRPWMIQTIEGIESKAFGKTMKESGLDWIAKKRAKKAARRARKEAKKGSRKKSRYAICYERWSPATSCGTAWSL